MNDWQLAVHEFHYVYGLKIGEQGPVTLNVQETELRWKLMQEELDEWSEANVKGDVDGTADALADLVYVVLGTAVAQGIDLDPVFEEVHFSNMSKLGDDGRPVYREDGKVMKGPNYVPPNVAAIITEQLRNRWLRQ